MMIPSEEVQEFGPVKLEKGALLTLTGKEATTRLDDGKPLLAQGTATSVADLLAQEKVDAPWSRQCLPPLKRSACGLRGPPPS